MSPDGDKATLDSAVDAAWDKLSEGVEDGLAADPDVGTIEQGDTAGSDPAPAPPVGKSEPQSATPAPQPGDPSRTRDERGRFRQAAVQSTTKPPAKGPTAGTTAPGTTTQTEVRELRPPPSFSPQAREAWTGVPKEVQAEIWRREREIGQTLQETAQAKQHAQWFNQTVGPYESIFRAEGVDFRTGLGNLLQAMSVLHGPSPYAKAQLWTTVAKNYGIDPDMLNQAWNGTLPQNGQPQAPSQSMDPRYIAQQAAQYALGQVEERRQGAILERAYGEVEQHAQQMDFFEDLRPMMSALMDSAASVKQHMDVPMAYQLALAQRPDLQAILDQRSRAQAASQPNPTVQRARAASSSIRGLPSPPAPIERKPGLDGAVDAAWDSVVRRTGIL